MRRRKFVAGFTGTAVVAGMAASVLPKLANAQATKTARRLGVLLPFAEGARQGKDNLAALDAELQKLGWPEEKLGRLVRWFAGDIEKASGFCKEFLQSGVDIIVVQSTPGVRAAMRETSRVPIVFTVVSEPLRQGLTKSLARPDGNITGFSNVDASIAGKWIQFLKELVPNCARAAILHSPDDASWKGYWEEIQSAGGHFNLDLLPTPVRSSSEIALALKGLAGGSDTGMVVVANPVTSANYRLIVEQTLSQRIPIVCPFRYYAEAGALLSYGIDITDLFRRASRYVDRILAGTPISELPIQNPEKFDLVINLRTAKKLGVSVSSTLLAAASELIE